MLVFLDLDGVMIPAKPWKAPDFMPDGFPAFSEKAVLALNWLLENHRITALLLTSSHKARYSLADWGALFRARGIDARVLMTIPENVGRHSRKEEIMNWLQGHPQTEPILILDDDASLHELPEHLRSSFLQPCPMVGITPELLRGFMLQRGRS